MSSELMSDLSLQSKAQARFIQRTINLKRLFYTRYKYMIGVAAAVSFGLAIPGWFLISPQYMATAVVQFSPTRPSVLPSGQAEVITDYTAYVETEANKMRGAVVQARVAMDAEVLKSPIIGKQADPTAYLMKHISAVHTPNTQHVDISFQSEDRTTALNVVNATVKEYTKLATAAEASRQGQLTQVLIDERKRLDGELDRLTKEIQARRDSLGTLPLSNEGSADPESRSYHDNYAKSLQDQTTAEVRAEELQTKVARLEELSKENASNPGKKIYEFGVEARVPTDPTVMELKRQLAIEEAKLASVADTFLPDQPKVKVQQDQVAAMQRQVAESETRARKDILQSTLEQYRLDHMTATSTVEDARKRVAEMEVRITEYQKEAIGARNENDIVREMVVEKQATANELRQIDQSIRERNADSQAPASIMETIPANAPERPNNRKRVQVVALCFLFGIACGLALGFLMELFDQHLHSAEDIRFVTDLPLFASVPHVSADSIPKGASPALIAAEYPGSTTANEYRRVLTRIVYPPEGSAEINTCLVTSASRGDGKTTLATNLAIVLAQANRRVLLLDISARRPGVEKAFGMNPGPGLSEVFAGEVAPNDVVRPSNFPNLSILGPGLQPQEIIGKLASRDMVEFLEQAEEAFEHVIIDSPPVLLMSDGKLVAPVVDGVVVVAGVRNSTIGMLRRTISDLQSVGANLMGVVLTGVLPTRGGYMKENLEQFYQYGDELLAEAPRSGRGFPSRGAGPAPSNTIMLVDLPPRRELETLDDESDPEPESHYATPVLVDDDGETVWGSDPAIDDTVVESAEDTEPDESAYMPEMEEEQPEVPRSNPFFDRPANNGDRAPRAKRGPWD
ncbi:MAG: hypothetical protein AMXMBFR84_24210 [Candidatus Hydrogenedentota bacterium]